jgi:hypothetical protein
MLMIAPFCAIKVASKFVRDRDKTGDVGLDHLVPLLEDQPSVPVRCQAPGRRC